MGRRFIEVRGLAVGMLVSGFSGQKSPFFRTEEIYYIGKDNENIFIHTYFEWTLVLLLLFLATTPFKRLYNASYSFLKGSLSSPVIWPKDYQKNKEVTNQSGDYT